VSRANTVTITPPGHAVAAKELIGCTCIFRGGQVALKRRQAAEDAAAVCLRAAVDGTLPVLGAGPVWGPGTVSPPQNDQVVDDDQQPLHWNNGALYAAGICSVCSLAVLTDVLLSVYLCPLSF